MECQLLGSFGDVFSKVETSGICSQRDEAGRSKGWGIVEFETPEEASRTCQPLPLS